MSNRAVSLPLMFSYTGGAAPGATKVMRKRSESYADAMDDIRSKASSSLRGLIRFLRGCKSRKRNKPLENSIGAIIQEGRLQFQVQIYNMKHLRLSYDAVDSYPPLVLNKQGDRSMTLYRRGTSCSISRTRTIVYDIVVPLSHFQDFCPLADLTPFELSLRLCKSYISCLTYQYARPP